MNLWIKVANVIYIADTGRTYLKFCSDLFTFKAFANLQAPMSVIRLALRLHKVESAQ